MEGVVDSNSNDRFDCHAEASSEGSTCEQIKCEEKHRKTRGQRLHQDARRKGYHKDIRTRRYTEPSASSGDDAYWIAPGPSPVAMAVATSASVLLAESTATTYELEGSSTASCSMI